MTSNIGSRNDCMILLEIQHYDKEPCQCDSSFQKEYKTKTTSFKACYDWNHFFLSSEKNITDAKYIEDSPVNIANHGKKEIGVQDFIGWTTYHFSKVFLKLLLSVLKVFNTYLTMVETDSLTVFLVQIDMGISGCLGYFQWSLISCLFRSNLVE